MSPGRPVLPGTPRAAMHPPRWIAAWLLLLQGRSAGLGWEVGWARPGTTHAGTPGSQAGPRAEDVGVFCRSLNHNLG